MNELVSECMSEREGGWMFREVSKQVELPSPFQSSAVVDGTYLQATLDMLAQVQKTVEVVFQHAVDN